MKYFAILVVFLSNLLFFSSAISRTNSLTMRTDIVGVWQAKTPQVSSALHENFQFFKDGKFIFNINNYDDLNPLRNISGNYKIENNILKLKVIQIRQRTRYKILETDHGFQSGSFQIKGGDFVIIRQNDTSFSEHEIEFIKTPIVSIKIDDVQYFKLSDDPNKFTTK